jgi:hypothetical protein
MFTISYHYIFWIVFFFEFCWIIKKKMENLPKLIKCSLLRQFLRTYVIYQPTCLSVKIWTIEADFFPHAWCLFRVVQESNLINSNHTVFGSQDFQYNIKRLCWVNLDIFSQSQSHIQFVKSLYNTFRGVNWKILRLKKKMLQFTEKKGDEFFDVIHGFVDKLSYKKMVVRTFTWHIPRTFERLTF